MLEKEIKNFRMAQEQLERKIYEITKNIPSGSLSVEEGIKEARKNKTILEAAKRLADK